MIVIADTSPLNYLVLIDEVHVLPRLYARVLIPEVVCNELRHPETPHAVAHWVARLPSWIEVVPSAHASIDPGLAELDAGECAAIF